MGLIKCLKCTRTLSKKTADYYEYRLRSGKNIHIYFPWGLIICPQCGTINKLPPLKENITITELELNINE